MANINFPLLTKLHTKQGSVLEIDLANGVDLSNAYFSTPETKDVFGLPKETKDVFYSLPKTTVNVDHLHICVHNNRTHTESTKHVYANGLNIDECNPSSSIFGCTVITVQPIKYWECSDEYDCHENVDNDYVISKAMIACELHKLSLFTADPFLKQAIFIRVQCGNEAIDKNKNWPFLTNDAMQYLHDNISNVFGINLCSVDREVSPKLLNHKIWFDKNAGSKRLIVEGLDFDKSKTIVKDGFYVLDLQMAPIANTDAVPTRPIIYEIFNFDKKSKL